MSKMELNDIPFRKECYAIIGACMEVSNELGCGFLEPVYQEALALEFLNQKIPFEKEKALSILYKGEYLDKKFLADFVCFNEIILELMATDNLLPIHTAQILNYLKVTGKKIGLAVNFGSTKLQYKRIVR